MTGWNRRKSLDALTGSDTDRQLTRTLSWPHLVALGVGAIVVTGIYTLIGVGANLAGPAVILSFALAGAVCARPGAHTRTRASARYGFMRTF